MPSFVRYARSRYWEKRGARESEMKRWRVSMRLRLVYFTLKCKLHEKEAQLVGTET